MFWTESAFQYRYAKKISEASGIPGIDKAAEFPEGYKVKKFRPILTKVGFAPTFVL